MQEFVRDGVVAAVAKGDPFAKHGAEDQAVPDVDNGIVFIEAPDVIGHGDTGASLLDGIEISIHPAFGVAHIGIDEDDVRAQPISDLKDGPVRPGAACEAGALGKAEGFKKRYDFDTGAGWREVRVDEDGASPAFADDYDGGVLHACFEIALRSRDERADVTCFLVKRDADDHACGTDGARGCLDIGLDEAAELIDFPGAPADEQRDVLRGPKPGDCETAQSAEHRRTLHEVSIAERGNGTALTYMHV